MPPVQGPTTHAPGPRGMVALLGPLRFQREPLGYLAGLRRYGPIVRTRAGPLVFHTLFEPGAIRHVLVERADNYIKRGVADELAPVLGDGILISEGARWRSRRTAAQPSFSKRAVEVLLPAVDAEVQRLLERWKVAGAEVDASADLMRLTLAVVGRALFGVDLGERATGLSRSVEDVAGCAYARARALLPIPLSWPTPTNRRYLRAIAKLDQVVRELLRKGNCAEVFQQLARVIDPLHGQQLSEDDLRDEAMSLFLAGHETTASTLAWLVDHLGRAAKLQVRARAEAISVGRAPSLETALLARLPLIDALIAETLRLHPPAWVIMRRALAQDNILGYDIPARSFLTIPVHALHRLPEYWSDPDSFLPERFQGQTPVDPAIYMPFGLGPRRCLGEAFAQLELRALLVRLLASFEWQALGSAPQPLPLATLRPATAVRLHLQRLS